MAFFRHVLVPVATDEDARTTCEALEPYLGDLERVTAVHVIEKGDGAIDKAPIGKRREDAAAALEIVESGLADAVAVETRVAYESSVAAGIFEAAADANADAIAFHARGGSRLVQLLAGDVSTRLVTDPTIPVVSLPAPSSDGNE